MNGLNEPVPTNVGCFEFVDMIFESSSENVRAWGPPLSVKVYLSFFDISGKLIKNKTFRENVFYGGISHELRKEAWKFLLG